MLPSGSTASAAHIGSEVLRHAVVPAGDTLLQAQPEHPSLFIVVRGGLKFSTGRFADMPVAADRMFFVPANESFICTALEETEIYRYTFMAASQFWFDFSVSQLGQELLEVKEEEWEFITLPVKPQLASLFGILRGVVDTPEFGQLFWDMQTQNLIVMMMSLYNKRELSMLLRPLFQREPEFKRMILANYRLHQNANDLVQESGMPSTTFRRKFLAAFGVPVGKWLIDRRTENIYYDILYTDQRFVDIAKKYALTPTYLVDFCRRKFGRTPTALRKSLLPPPL